MAAQTPTIQTENLLREVSSFPLLDAIFGRRARRFGLGMTIPDGPLAYRSSEPPVPLSEIERMLLVLCGTGISGWNTGIEHTTAGQPDTGCNYPMRLLGRTFPSGASIYASELIFTDDEGTYLTRLRDLDPQTLLEGQPVTDLSALVERVKRHCVRLSPARVTVPTDPPHTSAHNVWNANKPGTTLFAPVIDLTQQMMDLMAVYLGMGFTPFDPQNGRVCGNLERFVRRGLLDSGKRFSILEFDQYCLATGAMELALICHNIVLAMQAMGLGGWMYTGINPASLMGAFADKGIPGLGFRFVQNERWAVPNPVGIDGHFEGLCPPYCADMREAVQRFVDIKFGPGGTFDPQRPGPYKDNAGVKAKVERYTAEFIEMMAEVAQYIHDTFGRFPATVPSFYMRVYTQAQHCDLEFYRRFFGSEYYLETHATHMSRWHGIER
jgi:hypothetical protein